MQGLRAFVLVLTIFAVSAVGEKFELNPNREPPCNESMRTLPERVYQCFTIAQTIDAVDMVLAKYYIGESITLNVDFTRVYDVCTSYKYCGAADKWECDLPRRDVRGLCAKMHILKSPYVNCLRELRQGFNPIKSPMIEGLVHDFTNYGLSQKCLYLSKPRTILEDLIAHCGLNAAKSFLELQLVLQSEYHC